MPRNTPVLAQLALGLITLTGMAPAFVSPAGADDDPPVRAWVEFDEQGSAITITAHAWAPQPVAARYTLTIESVSDAGITRSRDSSRVRLQAEPTTLTRVSLATVDPRRIEVRLDVEPEGAKALQVRGTYPMSGAWVMTH